MCAERKRERVLVFRLLAIMIIGSFCKQTAQAVIMLYIVMFCGGVVSTFWVPLVCLNLHNFRGCLACLILKCSLGGARAVEEELQIAASALDPKLAPAPLLFTTKQFLILKCLVRHICRSCC